MTNLCSAADHGCSLHGLGAGRAGRIRNSGTNAQNRTKADNYECGI